MACKVIIYAPGEHGIYTFSIENCNGTNLSVNLISDQHPFFVAIERYGLGNDDEYVSIGEDGTFEYITEISEVSLTIPKSIATQMIEYVRAHRDEQVREKVVFSEDNPTALTGGKTRRNKSKCRKSKRGC